MLNGGSELKADSATTGQVAGASLPKAWLLVLLIVLAGVVAAISPLAATAADAPNMRPGDQLSDEPQILEGRVLSPYWEPSIQRWSSYVGALSDAYGFHPDFIAAVIRHESHGENTAISYMGAVGLMGVMPAGPGLEGRPSTDELLTPATNLRWGMLILSRVIQQSGGDLFAALAAYNGGWDNVNSRVPREYAARVLDSYARALVMREGLSPDYASQWTVAIEIPSGNVPADGLFVLGGTPITSLRKFARHTLFVSQAESFYPHFVRAYAVPLGLTEEVGAQASVLDADELEPELQARFGVKSSASAAASARVMIACLPSLTRLRGHANTRWYSPSYCPTEKD